jgi:hypothetical protein
MSYLKNIISSILLISPWLAHANPMFQCNLVTQRELYPLQQQNNTIILGDEVYYKKLSCTKNGESTIHIVHEIRALVSTPASTQKVEFRPIAMTAHNSPNLNKLMKLSLLAKHYAPQDKIVIAGINGGFFNMVDQGHKDDICSKKSYLNYGEADSYLVIESKELGQNCEPRPVMVFPQQKLPFLIESLGPNERIESKYGFALGGGPVLVNDWTVIDSYPKYGKYPNWIESQAARSAIGFDEHYVYLVTVQKPYGELNSGIKVAELANLMRFTIQAKYAMNLDGGGSATLCANDYNPLRSIFNNCYIHFNQSTTTDGDQRNIQNGLFIIKP